MTQNNKVIDDSTAAFITQPVTDALANIERVVADNRYNDDHKAAAAANEVRVALEALEERRANESQSMTASVSEWTKAMYASPAPANADEALRLSYTRDVLAARVQDMSPDDVYALWTDALAARDTVTARVLSDYAGSWLKKEGMILGKPHYDKLRAETNEMFMTDEQRRARANIERAKRAEGELALIAGKARLQLEGLTVVNGRIERRLLSGI